MHVRIIHHTVGKCQTNVRVFLKKRKNFSELSTKVAEVSYAYVHGVLFAYLLFSEADAASAKIKCSHDFAAAHAV